MSNRNVDSTSAPVWLADAENRTGNENLRAVADEAFLVNGDTGSALRLALRLGVRLAGPGFGSTRQLFETLATLAAADLTAARVAEAHLDALAILGQALVEPASIDPESGRPVFVGPEEGDAAGTAGRRPGGAAPGDPREAAARTWGVFAAEARGARLEATSTESGWRLDGLKPWCSLAGSLTHALVTAYTSDTTRRLFAVELAAPGVTVSEDAWVGRGLPAVPSGPVDFRGVPAVPIGDDGWYLERPGFAWGGIGVAACWWGGAVGVARRVYRAALEREPDQLALAHLGAIDVALTAAGAALADAARAIDEGTAVGEVGALRAARVRGLVARTVDEVIMRAGHSLGPSPLAFEARHAQRVADLQLYVRQHHAERDDAALGAMLLAAPHQGDGTHLDGGTHRGGGIHQGGGSAPW